MKWTVVIFLSLVCFACLNDRPTRFDHTTPEIDTSDQINYEGEDRHIWQKPDYVISRFGELRGKTVADLGAGSGYFAYRFLKKGARVIAIDIDSVMISLMREEIQFFPDSLKENFEARLAAPDDPHLEKAEIDYLFISNTYPYIDRRVQYFSRIKPAFKEGGKILIVDFKKKHTPIGPPQSDRLALGEVEAELIQAGYIIERSDDTSLSFQYIIIARPNKID
ncbi:MAG: methyltransferase domain-containing protein [Saprospiraceae bacterium]|nr:methyltransferase domain-containing protein [Saprospiraceae bacterium]